MVKAHPVRPYLKAWRKKLRHNQIWLANKIGTSQSNIVRQERGDIGVDDATFAAIAKAYGISVAELSAHPNEADKAQALDRLLTAVRQMDGETLAVVAGFAERIKPAP